MEKQQRKKKKAKEKHKIIIILILIINKKKKLKVVDCSLEIHGLFKMFISDDGWTFCFVAASQNHVDFTQFNVVDCSSLACWATLNIEASTSPTVHGMYCTVRLGPFTMAVKCWNVQCFGLIASLGTWLPWRKRKEHLTWCAIINNRRKNLEERVMRVIQMKLRGECTFYPRALNGITEWKSRHSLMNNGSCVQKSQLVGRNHYLASAHLTFSFPPKNKTGVIRNCVAAKLCRKGCFKV